MSEQRSERFEQGMKTRRSVLGDAHVDRAEKMKTAFDEPFQTLITEAPGAMSGPGRGSRSANAR